MDLITGEDFRKVPVLTFSYMHEMYFNICATTELWIKLTLDADFVCPIEGKDLPFIAKSPKTVLWLFFFMFPVCLFLSNSPLLYSFHAVRMTASFGKSYM